MPNLSLPRTLPYGTTTLLSAGPGRMAGSFIYLNPATGKTIDLLLGKVIYAGHNRSTVAFDNTSIAPATIPGDAAKLGLQLNQCVLIEPRFAEGATAVAHWFAVPSSNHKQSPAPQPRRVPPPAPKPVKPAPALSRVGVITFVASDFAYGTIEDAGGVRYIADAREVAGALRLHARCTFTPAYDHRGRVARSVVTMANTTVRRAA